MPAAQPTYRKSPSKSWNHYPKRKDLRFSGVCDHTISLGETDDLESLIEKDDTIVEKIEIDADNVDFEKAGEYEATYQITFDMEALNDWLDENERSVSFQTDTDPVIVKTTATITVQEDTAKTSDGSKNTEGTDKKQTASDDNDSEGSSSSNSSSNSSSDTSGSSSSQSNHQHNWQAHTATRTVTKTVTVVDTPAQTVHGAVSIRCRKMALPLQTVRLTGLKTDLQRKT